MGKFGLLGFIVYLILGLYFLNKFFNLISLSMFISIEKWIFLVGGILLIVGGIHFLKLKKKYPLY